MLKRVFHNIHLTAGPKPSDNKCVVTPTRARIYNNVFVAWLTILAMSFLGSCVREPELHLPGTNPRDIEIPLVDLDLAAYWNYELEYGIHYDWRAEWIYGWDDEDERIFGPIGYVEPSVFHLRRYWTRQTPYSPHTSVLANTVSGTTFHGEYNWGYWDILVWSDIEGIDNVQSLNIDEVSSLDSVTAYTNQSMRTSRFNRTAKYTRAFYQPEQLFAAYDQAVEISEDLEGFEYDAERNVWVKQLDMLLEPVTYIYLTQVVIHHNRNKVTGVDGDSDFSGMARSTNINNGVAGSDVITVTYNTRFKPFVKVPSDSRYVKLLEPDEMVAVAGGRLMTFGICNQNGNRIQTLSDVKDTERHYMDLNMHFSNGTDSTLIFDITDKVRERWKGGVITVELDMDTVPMPLRPGGSAFNAVVKDYEDGGTHEFEM